MVDKLPSPPSIPDLHWQPLKLADAAGLSQLLHDCGSIDGRTHLPDAADCGRELARLGDLAANTMGAFRTDGRLAAYGSVQINDRLKNELRAFLDGRVHLNDRRQGIGRYLLNWQEARSRQLLARSADERPRILRADFFDRANDAIALFEKQGFQYSWAEDTLNRSLQDLFTPPPLPAGMYFDSWREETAAAFFAVYDDAFRTRPGFPGWTEDVWRPFFTNYDEFRPDLSLLLMDGKTAVAYAIVHLEPEGPWIVQMGTRRSYRRQGMASTLIAELLGRFRQEGHDHAWLAVNVNNPSARQVYGRMGFGLVKRYTSYQKRV